ncbi:hypothetical protein SAY86_010623 [Trapa natans]|uniref:ubiquitinyl hydrolase 1 n=1 Tax=Trapa natans TaxID=22666 RepID=A0AAN7LSK9_TRANT|nr:hypothetical protein SAY86_010623 [Trapa natans]
MGSQLRRAESPDGSPLMLPPSGSPREAFSGALMAVDFEYPAELTANGRPSHTVSPTGGIVALTSNQPMALAHRPPGSPGLNFQGDKSSGFSPLTPKVVLSGVGAGLTNPDVTCFMNAVLQCLTHTVPLVQSLLSSDHAHPCDRSIEAFCLMCTLRDHIENSLNSSGGTITPMEFVNNLRNISPYFQRFQQEDAHEFQQALLDKLERCCLDQWRGSNLSSPKNIVNEVFGGQLISKVKCCDCGHCSCSYEPLIDLSLEIEHVDTLFSALKSFTKVEKMEDPESKFKCENCKDDVFVEKQFLLENEPTIAALHLKRFKTDGFSVEKIDKHVPFPLELDLRPFINGPESNADLKYRLYAIVVHIGNSPTWGHYLSFVQSSPGIWHKFDDSEVVRVREEFVLSQEAYILFYAKCETPWFSRLMGKLTSAQCNNTSENGTIVVLDQVDTPCSTPYYHPSPVIESFTSRESAHNYLGISAPMNDLEKVHSPCTPCTTFSNIGSSTLPETSDTASLYSENYSNAVANETRVDEDGSSECRDNLHSFSNSFVKEIQSFSGSSNRNTHCRNRESGELDLDENFHPLTPPEPLSPEFHNVQVKRHSDSGACNMLTTSENLRKPECSSCRKQLSKSMGEDPKMKEALRYMKRMPKGRACQLFSALNKLGPRRSGPKKVTKRRVGASICERASPSSARHRANSHQPILPNPVL